MICLDCAHYDFSINFFLERDGCVYVDECNEPSGQYRCEPDLVSCAGFSANNTARKAEK